jgi:hypothetical protein
MPISLPTFRRDKRGEVWQGLDVERNHQTRKPWAHVTVESDGARILQAVFEPSHILWGERETVFEAVDGSARTVFPTGGVLEIRFQQAK